MNRERKEYKRNLFAYIGAPILAVIFLGVGIWLLTMPEEAVNLFCGILLILFALFVALLLLRLVLIDGMNIACGKLYFERQYAEARAILDKKAQSPFFFLMRTGVYLWYINVHMALDDLPAAEHYIDILRHNGGKGWKYMTAYSYILIRLDRGETDAAHTEFEEFRMECAHAEIYRDQIEVLAAIFHRLYGTANSEPLPEAAVRSNFPVVSRILGKHYEARAAERGEIWEE